MLIYLLFLHMSFHVSLYEFWHTSAHCNTLQHPATPCVYTLATRSIISATHCNTLQHTATHCNTLQHTATGSLLPATHLLHTVCRLQTHIYTCSEKCVHFLFMHFIGKYIHFLFMYICRKWCPFHVENDVENVTWIGNLHYMNRKWIYVLHHFLHEMENDVENDVHFVFMYTCRKLCPYWRHAQTTTPNWWVNTGNGLYT